MAKVENKLIRRRIANAYLSSVISISLVLLLIGGASMLWVNAQRVTDYFKKHLHVAVLFHTNVEDNQAQLFLKDLQTKKFTLSTDYIDKERGRHELDSLLGGDFLGAFSVNPIPISINLVLKPQYINSDSLKVISDILYTNPLIEKVVYKQSLVDALNSNLSKISFIMGIFIFLFLFVSFVLINNTIRLMVFSKRFTVHTMKLVGATKSFIRRPFLWNSILLGTISSVIAIILMWGIMFYLSRSFSQLFKIFTYKLMAEVSVIVFLCGLLICFISTFLVVNKLISLNRDQLYS